MATLDLSQFAVGGAQRPDSFTGLDPNFMLALQAMVEAAPPAVRDELRITSGYRSPERQGELWRDALQKYGSPAAARKWVAPPGRSKHNHGQAVDFKYLGPEATKWAHANAAQFGLNFPLPNENWHIEPVGVRGNGASSQAPVSVASGEPAPAIKTATVIQDRPVAGVQDAPSASPTPAPAAGGGGQERGLGSVLAGLAAGAGTAGQSMGHGAQKPAASSVQGSGNPLGATMAAMEADQKARGLARGLMPDVTALMGLGGRKMG